MSSCSQKSDVVPLTLKGVNISFYSSVASPKVAKYFLKKSVVYRFSESNTYVARQNGKVIDHGDYSYVPTKGTDSASLMRSYSSKKGGIYIYEAELTFKDAKSGTWEVTRTSDPDITKKEKGTFVIVK